MGGAATAPCSATAEPDPLAGRIAGRWLSELDLRHFAALALPEEEPFGRTISSGWASLTGPADGAPVLCPVPLTAVADATLAVLAGLMPAGAVDDLDGAALLGERAAAWGQSRQGLTSPGGSCRLYAAADGWLALNLPRPDDHTLLPAWLETDTLPDEPQLAALLATRSVAELVARARVLGLAVAAEQPPKPADAWRVLRPGTPDRPPGALPRRMRVLDFSGLWAGPLCGQLLHRAGAEVVKLECRRRPDGARLGPAAFFDRLNAGKASVQLDFADPADRHRLLQLASQADVILEASRPRALRQLGLHSEVWLAERPGRSWIGIRGYSQTEDPEGLGIAFGDDAGVAAGLSALMARYGERYMVGDAIGDPLTGLYAALAGIAVLRRGGGLVELALVDVLRHAIQICGPLPSPAAWRLRCQSLPPPHTWPAPRAPRPLLAAAPPGADTDRILREWGC